MGHLYHNPPRTQQHLNHLNQRLQAASPSNLARAAQSQPPTVAGVSRLALDTASQRSGGSVIGSPGACVCVCARTCGCVCAVLHSHSHLQWQVPFPPTKYPHLYSTHTYTSHTQTNTHTYIHKYTRRKPCRCLPIHATPSFVPPLLKSSQPLSSGCSTNDCSTADAGTQCAQNGYHLIFLYDARLVC